MVIEIRPFWLSCVTLYIAPFGYRVPIDPRGRFNLSIIQQERSSASSKTLEAFLWQVFLTTRVLTRRKLVYMLPLFCI